MEIKINTAEMLGDEATIRDEVIDQVSCAITAHILKESGAFIKETLASTLTSVISSKVADLAETHLDTEFTEVDTFGKTGTTASMRNKIAGIIAKQCVFKNGGYSSDRNAFTNKT